MTTAFALWGGGSLGAAQVGMLRSLTAAGIRPDLVVGASVGALNGFFYAARPDPDGVEELADLWLAIGRHEVFPSSLPAVLPGGGRDLLSPLRGVLRGALRGLGLGNYVFPLNPATLVTGVLGRSDHLIDSGRFERFLRGALPTERLEDTSIPVEVQTADAHDGQSVPLSHGPALPALMASTAIPAVYPPVRIGSRTLIDGGVAGRTTLDRAVDLGADEVYLLAPGVSCRPPAPPSTALAMALHAYTLLIQQRVAASVALHGPAVRLHHLPPLCPVEVLPVDFHQTAELIERATRCTDHWLEHGPEHGPADSHSCSSGHPQGVTIASR